MKITKTKIRRYRQCHHCGRNFVTVEQIEIEKKKKKKDIDFDPENDIVIE